MVYHLENSLWNKKNHPEGLSISMLEDQQRLDDLIKPSIQRKAKDKVVIDLGCGSGILGILAFENGAKFVYFVEHDVSMVNILKKALPKLFDVSKFKIIQKFAQELTPADFDCGDPELCVSELQGPQLFDEGVYHCTAPLKQMYNNLVFIPETYRLDIFESDVDFNISPWPQHEYKHRLLEHYKHMYSSIGWTNGFIGLDKPLELINPKQLGHLLYDTKTGIFENVLIHPIEAIEGKMINLWGFATFEELESTITKFGWYVFPNQEKLVVTIHASTSKNEARVMYSLTTEK
jgi:SAM-dependent methyltransferase